MQEPPARRLLCEAPSGGRERGSSPRRPRGRRSLVDLEPTSRAVHVIVSWPPGGVHVEVDRYFGALAHASRFSRDERKIGIKKRVEVKREREQKEIELRAQTRNKQAVRTAW